MTSTAQRGWDPLGHMSVRCLLPPPFPVLNHTAVLFPLTHQRQAQDPDRPSSLHLECSLVLLEAGFCPFLLRNPTETLPHRRSLSWRTSLPQSSHSLCGVCAMCVAVGDCYSAGLFTSLPSSSQVDRKLHKVIDMSLSSSPTEMECLALSKYLLVDECIGGGGFEFWLEHG